jgi:hypothetical protein
VKLPAHHALDDLCPLKFGHRAENGQVQARTLAIAGWAQTWKTPDISGISRFAPEAR